MTELCQCAMLECRQQREAFALTRARKAEQPEPEYDWEDLEKQNGEQARALGAACAEVLAAVPAVPCSCGCTEPFEERGRGWPECPACGMV